MGLVRKFSSHKLQDDQKPVRLFLYHPLNLMNKSLETTNFSINILISLVHNCEDYPLLASTTEFHFIKRFLNIINYSF